MTKPFTGLVVSDKMEKTVAVQVVRVFVHPLYEKRLKKRKKFLVDNTIGAKLGDMVEICKTRPISKRKKWRVTKILSHATTQVNS